MATHPISGSAAPVTLPNTIPHMPAVARILAGHDRGKLAAFVTVAIDLLDVFDGDADFEGECSEDEVSRCTDLGRPVIGDGAGCDIADAGEHAWLEWQSRGRHKLTFGGENLARDSDGNMLREDDEDDDPAGQYDEDCHTGPVPRDVGAGCPISDPDLAVDDGPVDGEGDSEREQMIDDVPMLPVFSSAHNIFTDRRLSLGLSNVQTSYRTNGSEVRSAETGRLHRSTWRTDGQPGQPV